MEILFQHILQQRFIRIVFQPIVSLQDGQIIGYEALTRGPHQTVFENPETLFTYATEQQQLWELESICRTEALQQFAKRKWSGKLFLNVNPNIMSDEKFRSGFTKSYLEQYGIAPERIVFEVTEKEAIRDVEQFQRVVTHYKEQAYEVAIDDVGSGYSGLNLITDIRPHVLKLDGHLTYRIDEDFMKQSLVRSLVSFARAARCRIVAEGIETEAAFRTLVELGVDYGQGYWISRPAERPILTESFQQFMKRDRPLHTTTLIQYVEPVHRGEPIPFSTTLAYYPICEGKTITHLATSRPTDTQRHIHLSTPSLIDAQTTAVRMLERALMRPVSTRLDPLIVMHRGEYIGLVTMDTLVAEVLLKTNDIFFFSMEEECRLPPFSAEEKNESIGV